MDRQRIEALAARRHQVLTRPEALAAGATDRELRHRVSTGAWQRAYPGVYVIHSGQLGWLTRVSAALAHAGPGAALSHSTAADWWFESPATREQRVGQPVEVSVPARRTVVAHAGLRVHRRRPMPGVFHGLVAAVRPDDTAIDLVARAATDDDVVGILTRATRRVVHPAALLLALERRDRVRGRRLVLEVLGEVAEGVESPLELRYRRDVGRAHGLPAADLQVRERLDGRWVRADCRYRGLGVRVELDGRLAHPGGRTDRDTWRDNAALLRSSELTLRYRWSHVAAAPCAVAAQVAQALRRGGWAGTPTRCGPACTLAGA
ncbi:type IV toxin-antitoxin system AbiEi family antitoxin domain-containing protein [Georgenia wutianyii]|uniref:Type IV toxin-antitoxin system AbiEi family antitoxin domain-containing protein n=1 Tax=Georgenia wutianyii TaxID=2585135 RepID=A0ABX5VIE5_9MICO|nr:type IV toxin-antitoxin system AbiEi family antitoxin domain-containing protein [Georgenia wutianyii]QDB78024.1 type IV toxin-antitoxin system AbiEi family antitoxin domain-containing protein [Georgenia wutianyii]